jgi:antitoxin PrlF
MIRSKLTRDGRTTIPPAVRRALRLRAGDEIAYRISGHHAVLTRADRTATADPFAVFGEWSSEIDWRAYADL